MIEVNDLVKRYGEHTAVDHLSFQIEKGKIYGFLGPNGAGKSTTMNIITGYIASTEGKVTIDGHDILEEPEEAKKCIGYLPEQPPLYFDMTVLEYMKFVADLKKIPKNKKSDMIKDVMDMVGITSMSNRLIKNLKKKHTVILSSHILSEVSAVCDYVLIISHGKLVASDTPDNLSRLAAGSNSLMITAKGEKTTIRDAIEGIEGVDKVDISGGKNGNWNVKVAMAENTDIRENVFYAMASAKCPILEMGVKRVSLEDVFLELTEGEKKDHEPSDKKETWKPVSDKKEDKVEIPEENSAVKADDKKEGNPS